MHIECVHDSDRDELVLSLRYLAEFCRARTPVPGRGGPADIPLHDSGKGDNTFRQLDEMFDALDATSLESGGKKVVVPKPPLEPPPPVVTPPPLPPPPPAEAVADSDDEGDGSDDGDGEASGAAPITGVIAARQSKFGGGRSKTVRGRGKSKYADLE